jgi:hypothetical protein
MLFDEEFHSPSARYLRHNINRALLLWTTFAARGIGSNRARVPDGQGVGTTIKVVLPREARNEARITGRTCCCARRRDVKMVSTRRSGRRRWQTLHDRPLSG